MSRPAPAATSDTCAAIITYRPQVPMLRRVVESVQSQVGRVLIFDNGTQDPELSSFFREIEPRATVIRSPANIGLAAAMNRAADYARSSGYSHLLLLDQDSEPGDGMVATLQAAWQELNRDRPVAAVGPQFRDRRTGYVAPFVRIGFPISTKLMGGPGQKVPCDFLISSGTLLSLAALDAVGPMDEALFIDNVDLEWCFRARYHGMALYGICDAEMLHSIGDAVRPSRFVGGGIKVHSPTRLYYIMRNRVLLYARKETPAVWIAQDVPRLVLKFFSTLLLLEPRRIYLKNMSMGLRDALRGKTGPIGSP